VSEEVPLPNLNLNLLEEVPPPPKEDSDSENEDEEPRLTRREVGEMIQSTLSQRPTPKYHYINGMCIKIK
jgi:hypothetical protein